MKFNPVTIEDRDRLFLIIERSAEPVCDISFANLFAWSLVYQTEWTIAGIHTLVIRFRRPGCNQPYFLCPFCSDDQSWTLAIEELSQWQEKEGQPLVFLGVTPSCQERLERIFPQRFTYCENDGLMDYIYERERLASLSGKKLQSKRNHINKFLSLYPEHEFRTITLQDIPALKEFADRWLSESDTQTDSLQQENRVIHRFLDYYTPLKLMGGILEVQQKIVAFTLGSPINMNTFDVHIEKARADIEGAYTMINREFVRTIPEQYTYINREEDLGLPGLRQAKESYHPALKLPKIRATERQ
ncbi:MAG: DUF2156 domain-containing protein [Porphyromonas sp.]|nr:DUF2156 domain-containing protein [Porphyromonas sp.]